MLSLLRRAVSPFSRHPENPGLIWLDAPDAEQQIAARARAGSLTAEEAANLRKFAEDGYFIFPIDLSAEDAAVIDRDVDALWRTRPANVAFAYDSPPRRFSAAVEAEHRKPRYRIHELHSVSETALRLYLDRQVHRYASLILDDTAVANQSLYFEYGSQQALHRDSVVVPTPQFGRLVAAWIALEDIAPESGPLMYVPGSQRLPFYEFAPGRQVYDPAADAEADVHAAMAFYAEELERSRLPVKQFLARRGEVLFWHSALTHGGAPQTDPRRTRKSFVVHFSTLKTQPTRECAVREVVDGVDGDSVFSTAELYEREGAFGFTNPLHSKLMYRR
jgi:ectoine hydroxylase-related dioxygenase (phytanoyl-CoA dioxygenase family)